MSLKHAICDACFRALFGYRMPVRLLEPREETCCKCGNKTESGIFTRGLRKDFPHCPDPVPEVDSEGIYWETPPHYDRPCMGCAGMATGSLMYETLKTMMVMNACDKPACRRVARETILRMKKEYPQ